MVTGLASVMGSVLILFGVGVMAAIILKWRPGDGPPAFLTALRSIAPSAYFPSIIMIGMGAFLLAVAAATSG